MPKLQDTAQQVTDALLTGNLDKAETSMCELQRQIALYAPESERRAAAAIVLEARKFARIHRAQTLQTLQSLGRQKLYATDSAPEVPTFDVDG